MKNLISMIQSIIDLKELKGVGLSEEEVEGYLDFFATEIVESFDAGDEHGQN